MRKIVVIDNNWFFTKEKISGVPESAGGWDKVNLPHTWNACDGYDGGADYFRGECWYYKELEFAQICKEKLYYIEFGAVASKCTVYVNGKVVCTHRGGYSSFRHDITKEIKKGKNKFAVCVSNRHEDDIYPQMADFTFYGGIHRSVKLIEVEKTHFDLDYFGAKGVIAYSDVQDDGTCVLSLECFIKNGEQEDTVRYSLIDAKGNVVCETYAPAADARTKVTLSHVHLWQGIRDPYLYTVEASIIRNNDIVDCISVPHGFRKFYVDAQKGFFLNGEQVALRGVSRHGDKLGCGLAMSEADHEKDAELIREVGANTVRLAHYQHDEYFYDLCDRYGFVVWAEIPFISKMNKDPRAHENCISQMKELVYQCFNHPCICFWGISNEITIGGTPEGLVHNLKDLNDLVHEIDKTRLTTMAQVTMLPMEDEQNQITDVLAYNHYFGWYGGELSDNEKWLDEFHAKYPDRPLGISEYGCEGIIKYHTGNGRRGDYSEEYQARYHEHMLEILSERDWIWGSYAWNMFDFGCDARDEGGVAGRNNKGLVSFDRKIKKDSFYICKAYWSDEGFVHICSKRFFARTDTHIDIKVYSSCDSVSLTVNGKRLATQEGKYVFEFRNVALKNGENTVVAQSGIYTDTTVIKRCDRAPEYFVLREDEEPVSNWFDEVGDEAPPELTFKKGFYSIKNTVREILGSEEAGNILVGLFASVSGMKIKKSTLMIMGDQTPEGMVTGAVGAQKSDVDTDRALKILNAELQKIEIKNDKP